VSRWQRGRAIYRPPFGKSTLFTLLAARRRGADPVWWTVDSGDSWAPEPRLGPVIEQIERDQGGVVLMHDYPRDKGSDGGAFTITLTDKLLSLAAARGWRVCTISELLYGAPPRSAGAGSLDGAPANVAGRLQEPGVADG
jgi:hypothetical protein